MSEQKQKDKGQKTCMLMNEHVFKMPQKVSNQYMQIHFKHMHTN